MLRRTYATMAKFLPPPPFPGSRRVMLFDLDETLYPRESGLIKFQRERAWDFMAEKLHVARDKVPALWRDLFAEHNQTFAGLLASVNATASERPFGTCLELEELYAPVPVVSATNCLAAPVGAAVAGGSNSGGGGEFSTTTIVVVTAAAVGAARLLLLLLRRK